MGNAGSGFVRPFPHSISFRETIIFFPAIRTIVCRLLDTQINFERPINVIHKCFFFGRHHSQDLSLSASHNISPIIRHKQAEIDPQSVRSSIWSLGLAHISNFIVSCLESMSTKLRLSADCRSRNRCPSSDEHKTKINLLFNSLLRL